jgi:nucleoside-diphosphate-sugar epimerase
MIEAAINRKPFRCPASPERGAPMIYHKDAAKAAVDIMQAPPESIKMVNYNVGGVTRVTAREIEAALKSRLGEVNIEYAPPAPGMPAMREIAWNDSYARNEWGWTPRFSDIGTLITDFMAELGRTSS